MPRASALPLSTNHAVVRDDDGEVMTLDISLHLGPVEVATWRLNGDAAARIADSYYLRKEVAEFVALQLRRVFQLC